MPIVVSKRKIDRGYMLTLVCNNCGKKFEKHSYAIKKSRYCSKSCAHLKKDSIKYCRVFFTCFWCDQLSPAHHLLINKLSFKCIHCNKTNMIKGKFSRNCFFEQEELV